MADGDSASPPVISHYRLDEEIGRGGMGAVYRATDMRDGSVVAVKLLRAELAQDPSYRERFEREAHVAALLRSPYTVHLTDYGFAEGQYFLVMEYVDGQSLREALSEGPLPAARALRIGEKVARALEEADARGVVHRDIKPDNVMLGEGDTAKVLDFGIARQQGTLTLTVAGGFVGSFHYSSPEHATGNVDHRSDIYSLGATLYQTLVGAPPFSGTALELMEAHRSLPMPEEPLAGVPRPAVDIVRRCLDKDPAARFQNATALAAACSNAVRAIEEGAAAETALAPPGRGPAETVAAAPPTRAAAPPTQAAEPAPTEAAPPMKAAAGAGGLALALTNARPARRLGLRTGSRQYDVRLRNDGDTAVTASLTASDPDNACRFQIDEQVDTSPGAEVVVPLRISPRKFRWHGGRVRREFSVAAEGGGGPPQRVSDAFDDTPPRWPMAGGGFFVIATIAAVLVGLLASGGGGDAPGEQAVSEPAAQTETASETAGGVDETEATEQSDAEAAGESQSDSDAGAQSTETESESDGNEDATAETEESTEEADGSDNGQEPAPDQNEPLLDLDRVSGGRITFISNQDGADIMLSGRPDGADRQQITDGTRNARGPDWSPDGRRIVYASEGPNGNFDIWTISASGENRVQLTDHPDFDGRPAWSPDGERIAFVSTRGGSFDIWLMTVDGENQNQLTTGAGTEFRPAWSPDGTEIAYSSTEAGLIAIFVREVPRSPAAPPQPPRQLTDAAANDAEPAWSPDGRLIAFESDRDGNSEIYVMNADGSGQIRLTDNAAADLEPAWSPDSRFVIFMSERDGNANLYVVEVATGAVGRLTNEAGSEAEASWDDGIEEPVATDYRAQLTAISEQAAAEAQPFLDRISNAPTTQAQLTAIENEWPEVIGIQSDALRQIEELTPPQPLRRDHDLFVAGLRDLLNAQIGLVAAAQTGDVNRVAQANGEVEQLRNQLLSDLSPEFRALVTALLE